VPSYIIILYILFCSIKRLFSTRQGDIQCSSIALHYPMFEQMNLWLRFALTYGCDFIPCKCL